MNSRYGELRCFDADPIHGFLCTKVKDHDGPHVALGGQSVEPLASWPNRAPKLHLQVRHTELGHDGEAR